MLNLHTVFNIAWFLSVLVSCGKNSNSYLSEEMDRYNNPSNVAGADRPLDYYLSNLPETGYVEKPVWNSSWYPNSQGGTAYRSNPSDYSPMEKYDLAVNDASMNATRWEKQRSLATRNIPWAGHCNGLAAASTMADSPKHSVVYNNINFTVEDVKALLIEAWQDGGTVVGGRCNAQRIYYDTDGRMTNSSCRDLNPATFHIALANFLGLFHKPIIADIDSGYPVWNYPIVDYTVKLKQKLDIRSVNWWLFNREDTTYRYNPNAISFMYYQTEITLSIGSKFIYEYILELDASDIIVGGEWFRNAKENHPDFIWRHTAPMAENPYLNIKIIYDIYFESLG